jgi:hypothetical protein
MEPAPIACSLGQGDLADRQRRWHALADGAILDVISTDHGLRMRFRRDPRVESELRDLAALEQDCCAFADWTVHRDDDAYVMDIRGTTAESIPAVQEMFTSLRAGTAVGDE